MKIPSKESRKKRLGLVLKFVLLPVIILFVIVYFGLNWYLTATKKDTNTQTNTNVEPVKDDNNDDQKVDEVKPPIKEDNEIKEVTKTPTKKPTTTTSNWWEYPSKIYPVTKSGNDLLVLVNKSYALSSSYAPGDLVLAEKSGIRVKSAGTYYLRKILINDLKALNNAAKADGVDVSIISAYRSYSVQKTTYDYWVKFNGGCVSCADKISARPGHSQHQLGTAMDFGTKENGDQVGSSFDNTKTAKWLLANAYKYGFVIAYPKGSEPTTGYSYESWHYRYIGVANAQAMKDSGKILELFLR